MTIQQAIHDNNITIYQLAQKSGVPYSTVNDICKGKTQLNQCTAETVFRLAQVLNYSVEELLEPYLIPRSSFENFKSAICHRLKELGDIPFLIHTLKSNKILDYFYRKWYAESFYLLAMVDYLSRINDIPLCKDFNFIRQYKLPKIIYPASILAQPQYANHPEKLKEIRNQSIPEFMRFNIVENEVRNVV